MDFVDINMLLAKCDFAWSLAEIPTKYLNCINKARRQLACANVQIDKQAMMLEALKCFKDAGDYNAPIQEWEARPAAAQTYANLKTMMSTKYSKINCQDAVTARATGHALANNVVKEFAQAMEELVAELTEKHSKQIEALIKANNEAMAKLTADLLQSKAPSAAPAAPASATQNPSAAASEKMNCWKKKC